MRLWNLSISLLLVAMASASSFAAEMRDVAWKCSASECSLVFQFDPAGGLPSYFQKYDAARKVLRIGFSTTGIKVPPGSWDIDAGSAYLQRVTLKQEATARGVSLLVFEWNVGSGIQGEQKQVRLEGNSKFVIPFPAKSAKKTWTLSAASKTNKTETVAPTTPEKVVKTPIAPTNIVAPPTTESNTSANSVSKTAFLPKGLSEVSWIRGFGAEHFVIRFPNEVPANIQIKDSTVVIPLKDAAGVSQPIATVGSALVKEIRVVKAALNTYELVIKLKDVPVQLISRGSRFWIQANLATPPGIEQWMLGSKAPVHRSYSLSNADETLESLDQFAKGFEKSVVSSSQTFLLKKSSRELIVIEDVAVLRDTPSETGKALTQLKFGERLQSVELVNLYYKVKYKDVSGFVNRRLVSYPDELSHLQQEKMQQLLKTQEEQGQAATAAGLAGVGDSGMVAFETPDEDRITYSSFGRRDPFIELEGVVNEGINIDGVELVGIIWDSEVPMVLLTDSRNPGVSYTLKEGDAILNGKVLKITQDEVLFLINEFGVSRRYTMTLPDKYGGKK